MLRLLLLTLAVAASSASVYAPENHRPQRARPFVSPIPKDDLVAAKSVADKPPAFLQVAYSACGLATSAAWTTCVLTAIRSNAPTGMLMPSVQHGVFARMGALSAIPIIVSCFGTLASASADSWEKLGSSDSRRLNLAILTAAAGSAFWVGFAPLITQIPGTNPLVSHASYSGAMRSALIGAYGSAAVLSGAVWARSLPEEVRKCPLSWPGRVADGVAKSLFSLSPASVENTVNVKYAVLSTSFLVLTALQLGSHPLSAVPSWTGRRLARAFPAWTLLAATSSYNLKEAVEAGKLLSDSTYQNLSNGLKGFGAVYLGSKVGKVFLDPSFPASYHAIKMVPSWALAASVMIGFTLRPDEAS